MLHIDHDTKYYWYQDVTDFRKSFAGFSGIVREHMRKEVTDGGDTSHPGRSGGHFHAPSGSGASRPAGGLGR